MKQDPRDLEEEEFSDIEAQPMEVEAKQVGQSDVKAEEPDTKMQGDEASNVEAKSPPRKKTKSKVHIVPFRDYFSEAANGGVGDCAFISVGQCLNDMRSTNKKPHDDPSLSRNAQFRLSCAGLHRSSSRNSRRSTFVKRIMPRKSPHQVR